MDQTRRSPRTGRQKIRFVAPVLLGTAFFLTATSAPLAEKLKASGAIPMLRPDQGAINDVADGAPVPYVAVDQAVLPMLRPSAVPAIAVTTASAPASAQQLNFAFAPIPLLRPELAAAQAGAATAVQTAAPGSAIRYASAVVKPGDSLVSALLRAGAPRAEVYANLSQIKGRIKASNLKVGDKLVVGLFSDAKGTHLAAISWNGQKGKTASIALLKGAGSPPPSTAVAEAGMVQKTLAVRGSPSLPRTLTESGLPPEVSEQVMLALSQSRKPPVHGEMLKVVYQVPMDPNSGLTPRLSYASYQGRDGKAHVVRYAATATPAPLQHVDVVPAAMVALWDPLPGARISSPYGWRLHPVFHTRLFHKGVDYEAGAGTPIMAAADGIVEDVGRRGNYGNYIRLRHSGRLETAYAHLAGFAPTVAVGTVVHRGEVIGYVGMTGVATGPHLYYEVLVDGLQIDPEGNALKEATRRLQTQTARAF